MVRGPRARAVPKSKVMPEDGETLKAAMKAEKNGKLMNGNGSHQLLPPNPRKRGRNTIFSVYKKPLKFWVIVRKKEENLCFLENLRNQNK